MGWSRAPTHLLSQSQRELGLVVEVRLTEAVAGHDGDAVPERQFHDAFPEQERKTEKREKQRSKVKINVKGGRKTV